MKSPTDRSWPSTARRCAAASTRPAASRPFTWSAPGRRPTTSAWGRWSSTRRATRSRRSPNCWKCWRFRARLVTIDAMGCQTEIAQTIVDAEADYVLAVKKQSADACTTASSWFFRRAAGGRLRRTCGCSRHETHEKGHGREETRDVLRLPVPDDLPDRERWPKLAAIGMAINETRARWQAMLARCGTTSSARTLSAKRVRRSGAWPLVASRTACIGNST